MEELKGLIVGAINNINRNEEGKTKESMEIEKDYKDNDENSFIDELQEPLPRIEHKYCYICKTKFEKYLEHIRSKSHFENLSKHKNLFIRIRKSFEKIINFWVINNTERKSIIYRTDENLFLPSMRIEETIIKEKNIEGKKFNVINSLENKRKGNNKLYNGKNKTFYKINNNPNIDLNKNLKFNKHEKYYSKEKLH